MQEIHVTAPGSGHEIVSSRVFPEHASVVFAACTDGRQLARWWGPAGCTSTFHEFDPRPGGRWRYTMHGPDGADYANESQFLEVCAPRRIVLRHLSWPEFRMTITLADEHEGTRLTWRMEYASARDCAQVRDQVVPANEESFDRLAALLATTRRRHRPRR